MTWKLYDEGNQFVKDVGSWRIMPDAQNSAHSIVEYSVGIELKGFFKSAIMHFALERGVDSVTKWLPKAAKDV